MDNMNEHDKKQRRRALAAIYAAERAHVAARVAGDDEACQRARARHKEAIATLCKLPYTA